MDCRGTFFRVLQFDDIDDGLIRNIHQTQVEKGGAPAGFEELWPHVVGLLRHHAETWFHVNGVMWTLYIPAADVPVMKEALHTRLEQCGFVVFWEECRSQEQRNHHEADAEPAGPPGWRVKLWASLPALDRPDSLAGRLFIRYLKTTVTRFMQSLQLARPFRPSHSCGVRLHFDLSMVLRPHPSLDRGAWESKDFSSWPVVRRFNEKLLSRGVKVEWKRVGSLLQPSWVKDGVGSLWGAFEVLLIPASNP